MNWPSISIIIPSWNQGRYIERTILSILSQRYEGKVEVIVADGGSTDETVDVLRRFSQIKWWSERDRGYVDAVTKAMKVAAGEIIGIQSSDDFYLRNAFASTISELRDQTDLDIVSGCDIFLSPNLRSASYLPLRQGYITPRSLLFERVIPQHAAFFRRRVWDILGGMREEVDMCSDFDLWYRALHHFKAKFVPRYTAVYQLHPGQRTQTSDKWLSHLTTMVESCEANAEYSAHFRLDPLEKRNLYVRWTVHHLLCIQSVDQALEQVQQVLNDPKMTRDTKRAVLSACAKHPGVSFAAKAKLLSRLAVFPESFAAPTQRLIRGLLYKQDLDWWAGEQQDLKVALGAPA